MAQSSEPHMVAHPAKTPIPPTSSLPPPPPPPAAILPSQPIAVPSLDSVQQNHTTIRTDEHALSHSPERPAVSPITPHATAVAGSNMEQPPPLNINAAAPRSSPSKSSTKAQTHSSPPTQPKTDLPAQKFIPRPPSKPFSDSESTDAAALRAAISILQIQKEKSKRDIMTLQQIKSAAADDPDRFLQDIASGKLKHEQTPSDPLAATFQDSESSDSEGEEQAADDSAPGVPKFPNPQNVFRMPPINWSKYGIIGEPLDRMHDEQRRRPHPGEPARGFGQHPTSDHVLAAPYSPWKDQLDLQHPMQTRRGSTKPP